METFTCHSCKRIPSHQIDRHGSPWVKVSSGDITFMVCPACVKEQVICALVSAELRIKACKQVDYQERKNEERVEAWAWCVAVTVIGGAIIWFGCWFVRLFS